MKISETFEALLIAAYRDTAYNPIKCVETSGCNSDVVESQSSTQEWLDNYLKAELIFFQLILSEFCQKFLKNKKSSSISARR